MSSGHAELAEPGEEEEPKKVPFIPKTEPVTVPVPPPGRTTPVGVTPPVPPPVSVIAIAEQIAEEVLASPEEVRPGPERGGRETEPRVPVQPQYERPGEPELVVEEIELPDNMMTDEYATGGGMESYDLFPPDMSIEGQPFEEHMYPDYYNPRTTVEEGFKKLMKVVTDVARSKGEGPSPERFRETTKVMEDVTARKMAGGTTILGQDDPVMGAVRRLRQGWETEFPESLIPEALVSDTRKIGGSKRFGGGYPGFQWDWSMLIESLLLPMQDILPP